MYEEKAIRCLISALEKHRQRKEIIDSKGKMGRAIMKESATESKEARYPYFN